MQASMLGIGGRVGIGTGSANCFLVVGLLIVADWHSSASTFQ